MVAEATEFQSVIGKDPVHFTNNFSIGHNLQPEYAMCRWVLGSHIYDHLAPFQILLAVFQGLRVLEMIWMILVLYLFQFQFDLGLPFGRAVRAGSALPTIPKPNCSDQYSTFMP